MPYAENAQSARHWATDRAIACWAWFAGDLTPDVIALLGPESRASRDDGAIWALIGTPGMEPTETERLLADVVVAGEAPCEPWGLFAAMRAAGVSDVGPLAVLGASRAVLETSRRAGAGAVVALVDQSHDARRPLIPAQPDVMIEPGKFASLDAERYSSVRAH